MAKESAEFLKFHQFQKMEEDDDGTATIWGIATLEQVDLDGEICRYETAVPVYRAWASAALKRTKGAGQAPSMGPIRIQHGSEVGGKAVKLEYKDDAKEIWLGAEPISEVIHQQLKNGMYTGFSQGGGYAGRDCAECGGSMPLKQGANFCENCNKVVQVYYDLRRLAEVSFVDSPCTGVGFESVKSNGSCSIVKFAKKESIVAKTKRVAGEDLEASAFAFVGDPEKTDTWKLPIKFSNADKTKRHIRNALARLEQTKGIPADKKDDVKSKVHAAATAHGIDVSDPSAKSDSVRELLKSRINTAATAKGLSPEVTKGLYMVSRAADMLESMASLWEQASWERDIEGDGSEVPEELQELLNTFIDTFIAMATEEARELSARTSTGEKAMTPEQIAAQQELEKAAKKSLASHFAKVASHHEKMANMHEKLAEEHTEAAAHHTAAAEGCADCMGKAKKADVGDPAESDGGVHAVLANQQEFHKAMVGCETAKAAGHTKMAKMHDKHAEHMSKMAESSDEETAKAVKAEIATFDAANPEPKVTKAAPAVPAVPSIDEDVKKAAEAQRNSPEYKEAISALAKAQVDAEIAKLRDTTLAPTGTVIGKGDAASALKHLNIAQRDESGKDFAFASAAPTGNTAGL